MTISIVLKSNNTTGVVPTSIQLEVGEVAINMADRYLFTKDSSNTVKRLVGTQGNPGTPGTPGGVGPAGTPGTPGSAPIPC